MQLIDRLHAPIILVFCYLLGLVSRNLIQYKWVKYMFNLGDTGVVEVGAWGS